MRRLVALASALGIAFTVGIAGAPASQAVEAGKYEVQHLPGYAQKDGNYRLDIENLGRTGSVGLYPKGYRDNLPWVTSGYYGSATSPQVVAVPIGKCVWEEVWGNFGKTWYGNFTYCTPPTSPRRLLQVLEGSKLREPNGIESRLRFVQYTSNM